MNSINGWPNLIVQRQKIIHFMNILIKERQSVEVYRVMHSLAWVSHRRALLLVLFLCVFVVYISGVIGYELVSVLLFWLILCLRGLPCQYTYTVYSFNTCREHCYVATPWLIYPFSCWGIFGLPQFSLSEKVLQWWFAHFPFCVGPSSSMGVDSLKRNYCQLPYIYLFFLQAPWHWLFRSLASLSSWYLSGTVLSVLLDCFWSLTFCFNWKRP